MKTRLLIKGWERIRTSFWFVPSVMLIGAGALFFLTISADYQLHQSWAESVWYVYQGGADGALALLSTVAGSMITVTGVVFSITIVAFTLASSQFSPRLLRNYMRDPGHQITLGTFIATFAYCLLVLRTVRAGNDPFVPHVSVTCSVLLAVCSIAVLIYFVHHASSVIQAEEVIAVLGRELEGGLRRIFPADIGTHGRPHSALTPGEIEFVTRCRQAAQTIESPSSNYLQGIDGDRLMRVAREHDLLIDVLFRPGHFVSTGDPIAKVWPGKNIQDREELLGAFVFGSQRTGTQDFEFIVDQIVEVALRALSPSLNDPFTAMSCIDRLQAALGRLAVLEFPHPYRYDEKNQLRLILCAPSFSSIIDAAFHKIRQSARGSAAVLIRLLEAIAVISEKTDNPENTAAMIRHAEMIMRSAEESLPERNDREDALRRFLRVRKP